MDINLSFPLPGNEKEAPKNILVRVPSSLGAMIAKRAQDEKVSQTALINASLLLSFLAWGEMPKMGQPDATLHFLDELDRAAKEDDIAYGAVDKTDWEGALPLVHTFARYDFITDLRTRQENPTTIAYRFELTRLGKAALPMVNAILKPALRSPALPLQPA